MSAVREVSYDDIDRVAELHQQVGWPRPTLQGWQRLWMENPATAAGPAPVRGWVIENQDRIVGFMGNVVQRYHFGDRALRAATASKMVVAQDARGEAMKLVMAFAQQPHVDLLLNTTAAIQTSKIFEFFKFRRIPQPEYDLSYYWVLRPGGFMRSALRKRGWARSASGIVGTSLGPAVRAEGVLRRRGFGSPGGQATVNVLNGEEPGPEFDALWERRLAEGHGLMADRSAETLRWHYGRGMNAQPVRLVCARLDSRLVGFLALVREDSPHLGLTRAFIADIFVENDHPSTIRQLLAGAARQARQDGASMLQAVGFPEHIRANLRASRPFTLRNESWPFLYFSKDAALHKTLSDATLWRACLFDGDGSV